MNWRWDQGRLGYFQFEEVSNIAKALATLDYTNKPGANDPDTVAIALAKESRLPFLPSSYKVWRNYKRVFGCQLLATDIGGVIVCTEVCKSLAVNQLQSADYFNHFANNFSYPSPVFENYTPIGPRTFPFPAVIKYLIFKFLARAEISASLDEILSYVVGNGIRGTEDLSTFEKLNASGYTLPHDSNEYRQFRELVIFMSQLSYLKWDNPDLFLDVFSVTEAKDIWDGLTPNDAAPEISAGSELLRQGELSDPAGDYNFANEVSANPLDEEFVEGDRVRASHLKIERSRKIRELYFSVSKKPSECRICQMDTLDHYPWALRLIELHHILPLSWPIAAGPQKTSISDLVGLCPSCHRAVHSFYSSWLSKEKKRDFSCREEAQFVFTEAKNHYTK